jgi:hypothetical protein
MFTLQNKAKEKFGMEILTEKSETMTFLDKTQYDVEMV